jgi:hypothetical protein
MISVYFDDHMKTIYSLYGGSSASLKLKQAVCTVTTLLCNANIVAKQSNN